MGPLGWQEMVIIFGLALLFFGPRKLPELGRSLGKSIAEFKRASNELRSTLDEEIKLEEHRTAHAVTAPQDEALTSPSATDPETVARTGARS